jgi:hypothetical protein
VVVLVYHAIQRIRSAPHNFLGFSEFHGLL